MMSVMRRGLSLDSLIHANRGSSAISTNISGVISTLYAAGLLYTMMGRSVAFATVRKWVIVSRSSDLYTIGGSTMSPSAPSLAASAAHRHAWAVVYSATPVRTGTRFA